MGIQSTLASTEWEYTATVLIRNTLDLNLPSFTFHTLLSLLIYFTLWTFFCFKQLLALLHFVFVFWMDPSCFSVLLMNANCRRIQGRLSVTCESWSGSVGISYIQSTSHRSITSVFVQHGMIKLTYKVLAGYQGLLTPVLSLAVQYCKQQTRGSEGLGMRLHLYGKGLGGTRRYSKVWSQKYSFLGSRQTAGRELGKN